MSSILDALRKLEAEKVEANRAENAPFEPESARDDLIGRGSPRDRTRLDRAVTRHGMTFRVSPVLVISGTILAASVVIGLSVGLSLLFVRPSVEPKQQVARALTPSSVVAAPAKPAGPQEEKASVGQVQAVSATAKADLPPKPAQEAVALPEPELPAASIEPPPVATVEHKPEPTPAPATQQVAKVEPAAQPLPLPEPAAKPEIAPPAVTEPRAAAESTPPVQGPETKVEPAPTSAPTPSPEPLQTPKPTKPSEGKTEPSPAATNRQETTKTPEKLEKTSLPAKAHKEGQSKPTPPENQLAKLEARDKTDEPLQEPAARAKEEAKAPQVSPDTSSKPEPAGQPLAASTLIASEETTGDRARPSTEDAALPTVPRNEAKAPKKAGRTLDIMSFPALRESDKKEYGLSDVHVNMVRPASKARPYASAIINLQPVQVGERIPGSEARLIGVESRAIGIEIESTSERFHIRF